MERRWVEHFEPDEETSINHFVTENAHCSKYLCAKSQHTSIYYLFHRDFHLNKKMMYTAILLIREVKDKRNDDTYRLT